MNGELEILRREFADQGIGPDLYRLLGRIVRANVVSYPPAIYSPAGVWDENSLRDLLHDWIADRLLRGHLEAMLASASHVGSLKAQLSTSIRQLVINRRRRDSAGNLYKRTVEMLKKDADFEPVGEGTTAHRQWRLVGSSVGEPSLLRLGELTRIAYELGDDDLGVVRYGASSLKSSPILRDPGLKRFIVHVLLRAEGTLDATRLAQVQQQRFSLQRETQVELSERLNSGEPPVDLRVAATDAAEAVKVQLRLEDIEALAALANADWVVSRAAAQLGCSEGRISGARGRAASLISEYAENEEEARAIVRILFESLFS